MSIKKGSLYIAGGGSGSGRNIGDIFYTTRNDESLNGAVECNGGTYSTADYTGTGNIGELLTGGKLDYISLEDYATAISTKGYCDKIGWGGAGTTAFRVPTLTPHIIQTNNIPVIGDGGVIHAHTKSGGNANRDMVLKFTNNEVLRLEPATGSLNDQTNTNSVYFGNLDNKNIGATVDLSDTAQLRIMFQLFNATTDEAVATVGTVVADVSGLKDMSNITATGKEAVVGWGMPDYTAGVQVTTATQTAPKNGWVIGFMSYTGSNASGKVFINDIEISRGSTSTGTTWGNGSVQIAIKAGQTYRYGIDSSATVQQNRIYFYPNNE